jgi:hypothetical protein
VAEFHLGVGEGAWEARWGAPGFEGAATRGIGKLMLLRVAVY